MYILRPIFQFRWLCAVVLVTVFIGCDERGHEPAQTQRSVEQGGEIPESELPRIDLAGLRGLIAQGSREGCVLVIEFWATWCSSCIARFDVLHSGLTGLGPQVRLVTVTLDVPGDYEGKAVAFLKRHDALEDAYLLVPNNDARMAVVGGLGRRWRDLVVPAILIYGSNGELIEELIGDSQTPDHIIDRVAQMLAR